MMKHFAAVLAALLVASPAFANRESDALRSKAADQIYNLDRDAAIETYRQAIAVDPQDAAAYRGLAGALWLSITFRRGNMTVDDYLGKVSKPAVYLGPPPSPEVVAAFRDNVDKAIAIARKRVAANPQDADAHYQIGAAVGLRASFIATVDGSAIGAFRAAKEAYDEHELTLKLDPARKDAGLIVGTYRYIVSVLSAPLRWVAYAVGFGGDRALAIKLIEGAASYPSDYQADSRLALVLLYNRDQRYDLALEQLAVLRTRYPRNRLVWLESGATALRANMKVEAERFLDEGMTRFANDTRPRMYGEEALWYCKRGTARAWMGRADAEGDLKQSLALEGRKWVHGRAEYELGRMALNAGNRAAANTHLAAAVQLCGADNDPQTVEAARRLMQ